MRLSEGKAADDVDVAGDEGPDVGAGGAVMVIATGSFGGGCMDGMGRGWKYPVEAMEGDSVECAGRRALASWKRSSAGAGNGAWWIGGEVLVGGEVVVDGGDDARCPG